MLQILFGHGEHGVLSSTVQSPFPQHSLLTYVSLHVGKILSFLKCHLIFGNNVK